MLTLENTSRGWMKTYWGSPSVIFCRRTRQRDGRWELIGAGMVRMDCGVKRNINNKEHLNNGKKIW